MRVLEAVGLFLVSLATAASAQVPPDSLLQRVERSVDAAVLEGGSVEVAPVVGAVFNGSDATLEVDVEASTEYTFFVAGDPAVWLDNARRTGLASRPTAADRSQRTALSPFFPRDTVDAYTLGPWLASGPISVTLFSQNCVADCRIAYAIVRGRPRRNDPVAERIAKIACDATQAGGTVEVGPTLTTLQAGHDIGFGMDKEEGAQYDLVIVGTLESAASDPSPFLTALDFSFVVTTVQRVHMGGAIPQFIQGEDRTGFERTVSIGSPQLWGPHNIFIGSRDACAEGCQIGYALIRRSE